MLGIGAAAMCNDVVLYHKKIARKVAFEMLTYDMEASTLQSASAIERIWHI